MKKSRTRKRTGEPRSGQVASSKASIRKKTYALQGLGCLLWEGEHTSQPTARIRLISKSVKISHSRGKELVNLFRREKDGR